MSTAIIKELMKRNWDFILFETNQGYILNVVFPMGISDFSRSFRLTDQEANQSFEEVKALSEEIRENYQKFKSREIIPSI